VALSISDCPYHGRDQNALLAWLGTQAVLPLHSIHLRIDREEQGASSLLTAHCSLLTAHCSAVALRRNRKHARLGVKRLGFWPSDGAVQMGKVQRT